MSKLINFGLILIFISIFNFSCSLNPEESDTSTSVVPLKNKKGNDNKTAKKVIDNKISAVLPTLSVLPAEIKEPKENKSTSLASTPQKSFNNTKNMKTPKSVKIKKEKKSKNKIARKKLRVASKSKQEKSDIYYTNLPGELILKEKMGKKLDISHPAAAAAERINKLSKQRANRSKRLLQLKGQNSNIDHPAVNNYPPNNSKLRPYTIKEGPGPS